MRLTYLHAVLKGGISLFALAEVGVLPLSALGHDRVSIGRIRGDDEPSTEQVGNLLQTMAILPAVR